MKYTSFRLENIKPSPTLAINAQAKNMQQQGIDVINLSSGEPDFDTPEHIKTAAIKAIQTGKTKYTAVDGTPELKISIVKYLQNHFDLQYQTQEIVTSCGAKQSIFNLAIACLNKDDEVLIPAPYWVSYPDIIKIPEAIPVVINTSFENKFKITATQLQKNITSKTRMLILNSPSNPSGAVYSKNELKELATVLMEYPKIIIASDDIYAKVIYDDNKYCNILNVEPRLKKQTVIINGVSKAYAMTGWRIGYTASCQEIADAMRTIQSQSTSNPCSISQAAAIAALEGSHACVQEMVEKFKQRQKKLVQAINQIPGMKLLPASGAFYAFINIIKALKIKNFSSDLELAQDILKKVRLAGVPGSAFGMEGFLRISFAESDELLDGAVKRLQQYMQYK